MTRPGDDRTRRRRGAAGPGRWPRSLTTGRLCEKKRKRVSGRRDHPAGRWRRPGSYLLETPWRLGLRREGEREVDGGAWDWGGGEGVVGSRRPGGGACEFEFRGRWEPGMADGDAEVRVRGEGVADERWCGGREWTQRSLGRVTGADLVGLSVTQRRLWPSQNHRTYM